MDTVNKEENIFHLSIDQLQEIALSFKEKVFLGLKADDQEIQCLPTYVQPSMDVIKGKALVLDLGGTNYRAAVVNFEPGNITIHPENGWKKDLSVMKTEGYTREKLFREMTDLVDEIHEKELPIGYCFSYPAQSLPNGDAKLLRWTKGVSIREMIGQPLGHPLMDYLNNHTDTRYTRVKVINDTVASLFAGLRRPGYDAYIGLIVGTGCNMATFIPAERIEKLDPKYTGRGWIPVNLESGNFYPPYLTAIDDEVDKDSNIPGRQRFEKAVSGMYLGEILKTAFPDIDFEEKLDARKITDMLSYPGIYKDEYIKIARQIYNRSADLVAAALLGMILVLLSYNENLKRICLTAEGSLFWSDDKNDKSYKDSVLEKLQELLSVRGYKIQVDILQMDNANLVGSAVAALS